MNVATNAPRTLGAALGLLPTSIVGVVIAFAGTDWSSAQTASVVFLGAAVGSVAGFLAGDRVQKRLTVPRD